MITVLTKYLAQWDGGKLHLSPSWMLTTAELADRWLR